MKKPSVNPFAAHEKERDLNTRHFPIPDEGLPPQLLTAALELQKALDERAETLLKPTGEETDL
jgi:hypothetical protein